MAQVHRIDFEHLMADVVGLDQHGASLGEDAGDFGLARAFTGEPTAESSLVANPTITAALTQAGVIMGPAAYLRPEQATGRSVDCRAEMCT